MTDYTITTNFGAKDSLPSGNAAKVVKGSEFTTEFTNIATAVNSKADTAGDTFTGVVNFSAVTNFNADVAFDTDTLFVDVSADKVGINTDSPDEALHVVGNVKIEGTSAKLEFSETDADPDWSIINSEGALTFYDDTADTTVMKIDTSGHLRTDTITCLTSQQLVLNVGESVSYATGQTAEALYVNAESGLQVNSSSNNWGGGWGNRYTTTIGDHNGQSIFPTSIYVGSAIYHKDDVNTYTQFHNNDQWRVVTNGAERLEVTNTAVTTTTQFVGKGAVGYTDVSFYSNTDSDQTVTFSIPSGHAVINALITTSGFNYNAIKNLKNNSCVVDRYNDEGNQTVNLRVWHSKV